MFYCMLEKYKNKKKKDRRLKVVYRKTMFFRIVWAHQKMSYHSDMKVKTLWYEKATFNMQCLNAASLK